MEPFYNEIIIGTDIPPTNVKHHHQLHLLNGIFMPYKMQHTYMSQPTSFTSRKLIHHHQCLRNLNKTS